MTVRLSGAIMATAALALAAPALASADVSSLDAYAGQAAVLGKHHHKHHHHGGGFATTSRSGDRVAGGHGAVALAGRRSGSAAMSSGASSGPATSSVTTGGTPASGTRGAAGAAAGSGHSAAGSSSGTGGESALARGVRNAVPAASSSSSLTGLDVAILCAVALTLLATGLLIRRLSRQPR